MAKWRHLFKPKKTLTCQQCRTRFQFPIKPGKTLDVTCPKCRSKYRVSFKNPLMGLIKGELKWQSLTKQEKQKMMIAFFTLVMALGLIVTSLTRPIQPDHGAESVITDVL